MHSTGKLAKTLWFLELSYHTSHPHWNRVQKAMREYQDMMNDSVMQDSQDSYQTSETMKIGPSTTFVYKEHSEEK